jgi:hypothetical protein
MLRQHLGVSSLRRGTGECRPRLGVLGRGRRLVFEPLEDRRLLAVVTVNTLVDENGTGANTSLREAVAAANPGDTINFSVTGTINLTNAGTGHIVINKSLSIQGPGSNLLTIRASDDGANNSNGRRIFLIDDVSSGNVNVTISGLTLTNGDPAVLDENEGGGAILNRENLTLSNCVLTGNFSPNGGAIYNTGGTLSGTLTINDCTISGNDAGDGAAVLVTGGSLNVNRSTITNNTASNAGGGILGRLRPVTITDSTISGNFAVEHGGGLYQEGSSLSISGSTISSNAADSNLDGVGSGGGIYNLTGLISVVNSTISGNSAEGGGGIFSDTGQTISIAHSTITANVVSSTGSYGGGINSFQAANLNHTIVAGNLRGASTKDDVEGSFNAFYSLIGDKRNETVNDTGGSLIGQTGSGTNPPIDAKLALLANNGGPTLTHALLSNSPALEAGNPSGVGGNPQFDQRGTPFLRIVDFDGVGGARIDIGAVEMAPSGVPSLLGDYNVNHVVDAGDFVLWRKTNGGTVTQQYSGADGDGNTFINGSDYTVWRSRFGNSQPGAGSGNEFVMSEADVTTSDSMPGTGLAPKSTMIRQWSPTSIDTALDLLLVGGPITQTTGSLQTDSDSGEGAKSQTDSAVPDLITDDVGPELGASWNGL